MTKIHLLPLKLTKVSTKALSSQEDLCSACKVGFPHFKRVSFSHKGAYLLK